MELRQCASCGTHVRPGSCACPTCGASQCVRGGSSAAAVLLGITLAGCAIVEPRPKYGDALMDVDGDGFFEPDDCDDDDPDVHPGADEAVGDDLDSNCDGEDDS
jgi:hypothetical protein